MADFQYQVVKDGLKSRKPKTDELPGFVTDLFKDAEQWRKTALGPWRAKTSDPAEMWLAARKLEAGQHWAVWGRRNDEPDDDWKGELVVDDIQNAIRVRTVNLTSNWHEIQITPNISHINEIIRQDRQACGWDGFLVQWVHNILTEGQSYAETYINTAVDPDGVVDDRVLDNEAVFPTPFSRSLAKEDGCWYLLILSMVDIDAAMKEFPNLDPEKMTNYLQGLQRKQTSADDSQRGQMSYMKTMLVDKMELWWDDDTTEKVPFDSDETNIEHQAALNGQEFHAEPYDNHVKHIEAHREFVDMLDRIPDNDTPEARKNRGDVASLMMMHMQEHLDMANKKLEMLGLQPDEQLKYPNGRRTVIIGRQLAKDGQNPYNCGWRERFTVTYCEKLPNSFFGRGVAEALYNTNKAEDTAVSRFHDVAVVSGIPKQWFNEAERKNLTKDGFTNDPTEPGFYTKEAPTFRRGQSTPELLDLAKLMHDNAEKQQGVTDISYGKMPSANAPGKAVETLTGANRLLTSGEANTRMTVSLTQMVSTRLKLMKQFYKEPREYEINGTIRLVNVSDALSSQTVLDSQGQPTKVPIKRLRVYIKPDSNFPFQWERDVQLFLQLYQTPGMEGPLVTRDQVLTQLAKRYPDLGPGSPGYQLSQATQIGLQVMAKQKEEQMKEAQLAGKVQSRLQNKAITQLIGGSNGR